MPRVVRWGALILSSVFLVPGLLSFDSENFYPAGLRIAIVLCALGLYVGLWFGLPTGPSEKPAENKVQLGFGSLIIIGLIVMFFSGGRDSEQLRNRVDALNQKIDRLEQKIDKLYKLSREVDHQSASPQTGAAHEPNGRDAPPNSKL